MKKGFTLIELLIVVAIIAILAAIAIPNFLQAPIRAKISRANNDLRNIATGLESYYVDHNEYPPHNDEWWLFIGHSEITGEGYGDDWFQTLEFLTTPIAYMTGLSADPFAHAPQDPTYNYPYRYIVPTQPYPLDNGDPIYEDTRRVMGEWMVWSCGPDLYSHIAEELLAIRWGGATAESFNESLIDRIYDPTNGVESAGDIYRSQLRPDGGAPPRVE